MAKKRISSADLSWMIFDRLRDELGSARSVSVAVVSDRELGWRAVLPARARRKDVVRKLRSIEREFRSAYSLAGD
jgi:hypothetical protein